MRKTNLGILALGFAGAVLGCDRWTISQELSRDGPAVVRTDPCVWAHQADAVFVGRITRIEPTDVGVVFGAGMSDWRLTKDCRVDTPGLRLVVDVVRVLHGDVPDPVGIHIGAWWVARWGGVPRFEEGDARWPEGVHGPQKGQLVGFKAAYVTDLGLWTAQDESLFAFSGHTSSTTNLEQGSFVSYFKSRDDLSSTPLEGKSLAEVESMLSRCRAPGNRPSFTSDRRTPDRLFASYCVNRSLEFPLPATGCTVSSSCAPGERCIDGSCQSI